jgi:hypothetical protein
MLITTTGLAWISSADGVNLFPAHLIHLEEHGCPPGCEGGEGGPGRNLVERVASCEDVFVHDLCRWIRMKARGPRAAGQHLTYLFRLGRTYRTVAQETSSRRGEAPADQRRPRSPLHYLRRH